VATTTSIQLFFIYSQVCAIKIFLSLFKFQYIPSPQGQPRPHEQSPCLLPGMGYLQVPFPSLDLPVLDVSYQWSHTLCGLVCLLLSLGLVSSGSLHIVECIRTSLLLLAE
jgi:hypothetical protein